MVGGAEHGDEDLGLERDLTRAGIDDRHGLPGPVDEAFLAGAVLLAHNEIERVAPGVIVATELGVLVPVGVLLLVLQVQERERDVLLAAQLAVERGPVRQRP